jgi:hypothetical protein
LGLELQNLRRLMRGRLFWVIFIESNSRAITAGFWGLQKRTFSEGNCWDTFHPHSFLSFLKHTINQASRQFFDKSSQKKNINIQISELIASPTIVDEC